MAACIQSIELIRTIIPEAMIEPAGYIVESVSSENVFDSEGRLIIQEAGQDDGSARGIKDHCA